jgi:hypothetical protein
VGAEAAGDEQDEAEAGGDGEAHGELAEEQLAGAHRGAAEQPQPPPLRADAAERHPGGGEE